MIDFFEKETWGQGNSISSNASAHIPLIIHSPNIPQPKNSEVKLREIPGKFFAVNSYTGFNNQARVQTKTDELNAWVLAQKMKTLSSPQLSRYDPPWTLPMFRRNEIMIEIEEFKLAN